MSIQLLQNDTSHFNYVFLKMFVSCLKIPLKLSFHGNQKINGAKEGIKENS